MALDRQLALGLEPLLVCLDMSAHLHACTTELCTSIYARLWMLVDITQLDIHRYGYGCRYRSL